MSKYEPLWRHVGQSGAETLLMTFDEIGQILGFPIDHAFLTFKKELADWAYAVEKISMKQKTVRFVRGKT